MESSILSLESYESFPSTVPNKLKTSITSQVLIYQIFHLSLLKLFFFVETGLGAGGEEKNSMNNRVPVQESDL